MPKWTLQPTVVKPTPRSQIISLSRNRKLLWKFAYQELTLKYRRSVGGLVWALATPLAYLAIYSIAFKVILRSSIPGYPIFIWSGLLIWNALIYGMSSSTSCVTRSWGLVTKVRFPREILPFASVVAAMINMAIQSIVLLTAMLVFRWSVDPTYIVLIIPATIALALIIAGLGCLTSAMNVFIRDIQHLVDVILLAWFWVSPIIYGFRSLSWSSTISRLMLVNPITPIVLSYQRALYSRTEGAGYPIIPEWGLGGYLLVLSWSLAFGVFVLWLGLRTFGRMQMRFADEL
jgi:ABC-2 type transport system permease protein